MRSAFVSALIRAAESDSSIVLVTGDLGFGVLTDFAARLPAQFVNAGVAEQNMTAIACGLALEGRKVFTYSIANFATLRCLEQIRNDVCYHEANVTVVAVGGGYSYGQLGHSHFATEDVAIMRTLPGLKVFTPSSAWEAAKATEYVIAAGGPAYLRLDRTAAPENATNEPFEFGRARAITSGSDVAIFAFGSVVTEALKAEQELRHFGIAVRVVSIHTMKPFDRDNVIDAARSRMGIVSLEEHSTVGGLGSVIAETCMEARILPRFYLRFGLQDRFPEVVGDQDYLRRLAGIDAETIAQSVRDAMKNLTEKEHSPHVESS